MRNYMKLVFSLGAVALLLETGCGRKSSSDDAISKTITVKVATAGTGSALAMMESKDFAFVMSLAAAKGILADFAAKTKIPSNEGVLVSNGSAAVVMGVEEAAPFATFTINDNLDVKSFWVDASPVGSKGSQDVAPLGATASASTAADMLDANAAPKTSGEIAAMKTALAVIALSNGSLSGGSLKALAAEYKDVTDNSKSDAMLKFFSSGGPEAGLAAGGDKIVAGITNNTKTLGSGVNDRAKIANAVLAASSAGGKAVSDFLASNGTFVSTFQGILKDAPNTDSAALAARAKTMGKAIGSDGKVPTDKFLSTSEKNAADKIVADNKITAAASTSTSTTSTTTTTTTGGTATVPGAK